MSFHLINTLLNAKGTNIIVDPDPDDDDDGEPIPGEPRDPRTLGFLVADDFGADRTGAQDSTSALRIACRAAADAGKGLLLLYHPVGYKITNDIGYYTYKGQNNNDQIPLYVVGETVDGNYARVWIPNGTAAFSNANAPKAAFVNRLFTVSGGGITNVGNTPSSLFKLPSGVISENPGRHYFNFYRNIEVHLGNNAGAVGFSIPSAEDTSLYNLKITGNGYAGIYGGPASGENIINVEVVGCKYAFDTKSDESNSTNGTFFVAVKASGQTDAVFNTSQPGAICVTGFDVTLPSGTKLYKVYHPGGGLANTARGAICFVDGKITCQNSSDIAIHNTEGKLLSVERVYVTGTNNVIKSGSQSTKTQSGTNKVVNRYLYVDQTAGVSPPYSQGDVAFPSRSLINGNISSTAEPLTDIASVGSIPTNLLTKHYWASGPYAGLPSYYGQAVATCFVNDAEFGAKPNNQNFDSRAAIQKAIDKAATDGHNMVFLGHGSYYIGGPLVLKTHTQLFAIAHRETELLAHSTWISQVENMSSPTAQFYIHTPNDADADCGVWNIGFELPSDNVVGGKSKQEWFGVFRWQAGRNSATFQCVVDRFMKFWNPGSRPSPNSHALKLWSGNGGGRHYASTFHGASVLEGSNANFHLEHITGTSEPNMRYAMHTPFDRMHHAVKIENSSNVAFFGVSREETSSIAIIDDSTNISFHGTGRMRNPPERDYFEVLGTSDGVGIFCHTIQRMTDDESGPFNAMVKEDLDGEPAVEISFPICCHYLRDSGGVLDNSAFVHDFM